MKRFAMTSDGFHFWTPVVLIPVLLGTFGLMAFFAPSLPGPVAGTAVRGTMLLVAVVLAVCTMLTPKAVRLSVSALEVERWCWPAFKVPYSQLTAVEEGPVSKVLSGDVGRVAGVGGWFWSGGLFRAKGVGLVRAWLRRLGPTVVVRRSEGLPLLFGVDDPAGLREAIAAKIS